ncbi:YhgE/Pip domain-containing protein [Niallia alba]|uniref:YhgE/Pip family protein n=1 Tax=Niallia alba TaxID=2729105 RepID=UPI0039A27577
MFKHDWKAILTNRKTLVTIIIMAFIPIMYSGIILGSFWDPFGRTDKLPVAVVNQDKPTEVNDSEMTIGEDLIEQLKEDDNFDWHFVSKKQADEGFRSNEYYMVITIPEEFSANAATALEDNPQKMKLNYKINPGRNFFIENISKSAMTSINETISNKVTETYVKIIFDNIDSLGHGFAEAAEGVGKLEDGLDQITDGNKSLTENLNKLASSSLTFTDGARNLEVGIGQYTSALDKLNTGSNTLQNGIQEYSNGVALVADGITKLKENNSNLTDGTEGLVNGSSSLYDNLSKAQEEGSTPLKKGLQTLQVEALKLTNEDKGIPALASGQQNLHNGLTNLQTGSSNLESGLNSIQNNLPKTDSITQLTEGLTGIQQISVGIQKALAVGDTETAMALSQQLAGVTEMVVPGSVQALNGYNTISSTLSEKILPGAEKLNEGLKSAVEGSNNLVAGTKNLNNNIPNLINGINTAANGAQSLDTAMSNLVDGSNQLYQGTSGLQEGINSYTTGVNSLSEGASELTNNSDSFVAGANQLTDGLNQLSSNSIELANGSNQLTNGAVQISEGTDRLSEGSSKLGEGLTAVQDGTGELKEKLTDGANQVDENRADTPNFEMIASPTSTLVTKTTDVPNYGHALAPNFLSLALYIGALAFNMVIPLGIATIPPKSGRDWWFSKFSLGAIQAIVGALIMDFIVVIGLGLEVHHVGLFVLISILASLTYMFMIMMLGIALGNPGRFLAMILLVLQLASSGAMFPRELTGSFFDTINPFLPMTYIIYGFREAISSAEGMSLYLMSIAILSICIIVFNIILLFIFKRKKENQIDMELDNNEILS